MKKPPKAPPVYRPQPVPLVLQRKTSHVAAPQFNKPMLPKPPIQAKAVRAIQPAVVPRTVQRAIPHTASTGAKTRWTTGVIQRAEQPVRAPALPITTMRSKIAELVLHPRPVKEIADALFREFMGLGLGYELGNSMSAAVLGDYPGVKPLKPGERMRTAFGGNCIALANAFAKVLSEAKIRAEVREVRAEEPGKAFVVYCPHFIDQVVDGHIRKDGAIWRFHYLFTNHTAVWVPDVGVFYDPMAGTTYRDLREAIVMELHSIDVKGDLWTGNYAGREYTLTRRTDKQAMAGFFYRFDMVVVPAGHLATPLGVFKQAEPRERV